MNRKALRTLTVLLHVALVTTGCVAPVWDTSAGVTYGPPVEYGYQPLLYNGYVVYHTDVGIPYYWVGGSRVWVPPQVRARYVEHWRLYRPAYGTWYRNRGYYYQTHRFEDHHDNPPGHWGGPRANWENHPGPTGGPGAYPDHHYNAPGYRYRDGNPGPTSRPGTPWQNRPGPAYRPVARPGYRTPTRAQQAQPGVQSQSVYQAQAEGERIRREADSMHRAIQGAPPEPRPTTPTWSSPASSSPAPAPPPPPPSAQDQAAATGEQVRQAAETMQRAMQGTQP